MPTTKLFHLRLPTVLLFSSALFYSICSFAEKQQDSSELKTQKFYNIEIIVFKNISVPKGKELNLPTPSPTRTKQTVNLSSPRSIKLARKKGFTTLKQNELQLQGVVQRLTKSSRYEPLTHIGWRQPGLDKTKSFPVWIKGGKTFGKGYSSIDQLDSISEKSGNIETKSNKNVLYELEGQIIVTLSRYLHTQANLVLRKPVDMEGLIERAENLPNDIELETNPQGGRLLNYGLNEQRRMRSKRLHYLDHPQFGMLVLITPFEKPAEDPQT